jgi:Rps23 Pro-64 3,4-dihydroxylase Tpa1-like proline 4-hydroxylase
MASAGNVLVIDGFLGEVAADSLLAQIIASEANFAPSTVRTAEAAAQDAGFRSSLRLPGRVGVELDAFKSAVLARFEEFCAGTGVAEFPVFHTECSVVAHRAGDFYKRHIDTRTGDPATLGHHVRVLSCVYYLNRRPQAFSGGELAFYPLGNAEPVIVTPQHDRLAVFPAFVPHEVLPITSPSSQFADARFSINCWLHRAIGEQ